jgi:hypothetical protein
MIRILVACALLVSSPSFAAEEAEFDPHRVSELDAIDCRLDVPHYLRFAMGIQDEGIARKRRWKKIESANPFMNEYELPAPILVAGSYSTTRIAFTSNAILAILDLPDPATVARGEQIENAADPGPSIAEQLTSTGEASRDEVHGMIKFRKFLGERILEERTEPAAEGESFGARTIIARSVSNATTHPGKTLFGCSYRMELLDENGDPL